MDLLTERVYPILDFFDFGKVSLLALVCQFFKLSSLSWRQLVVPLSLQVLCDFSLAQVGQTLLHVVKVLVLENLESCQRLFG